MLIRVNITAQYWDVSLIVVMFGTIVSPFPDASDKSGQLRFNFPDDATALSYFQRL